MEPGAKRSTCVARCRAASAGRVDLAASPRWRPDLIFLDEPTTGFDPSARRNAWSVIRRLCSLGKTVFLTTHFMDEAQALADRAPSLPRGGS